MYVWKLALGVFCLTACGEEVETKETGSTAGSVTTEPTSTSTTTSTTTTSTSTTEPVLSCEDTDGDGRPNFDPKAPLIVTAGVPGPKGCVAGDEASHVVVFNGPQGGYHVDACFTAQGVPQEVFFVTKLRLVETEEQLAGGDETSDRVGVGLIEWSDETCEGYYSEARGLVDDLWATWPSLEEVCAWDAMMLEVEVEVIDYVTSRRGIDTFTLPIVLEGAEGELDCSDGTDTSTSGTAS